MHTLCLAVPVYTKRDNVYVLDSCVCLRNTRDSFDGMHATKMLQILKRDAQECISIFVRRGDSLTIGKCDGTELKTVYRDDYAHYEICPIVHETKESAIVCHETALCFLDVSHTIQSAGAVFDHNSAFKSVVPACYMQTYISNVCKAQQQTMQRLLRNMRFYEHTADALNKLRSV